MDEVATMTVPPTLPAKTQPPSQVARQTVSIRTVSNPPTAPLSTGAGATVFVGLAAPGVDSSAACRRRIPEVQAANGYGKQSGVKSAQSSPQNQQQQQQQQQHNNYNNHYQQQQQQQQQQAAHVVKIKINPDGEKNGRVISTVRLTLDEKVAGHEAEKENGIACERSGKRDGGVVVSATNLVNEQRCGSGGVGDGCVRISVGSNAFERNNNHDNSNLRKDKRDRNHDNTEQKDMVLHRETSIEPPMNASSPNNNRSTACFYYNSYPGQLNGMVMSSGQCSPSDTLDSGTCSDLDGTPPPLPKKKNSSTVILASDQHNRTGSLTSSGAEVDSDDNESNISCDSLNGGELTDRIANGGINGNEAGRPSLEFPERSENCRVKNGVDREKCRDTGTVLALNRLDLSSTDRNEENRIHEEESSAAASSPEIGSSSCSTRASPSVSPSPSGTSSLSKASSTPRIRSPVLATEQNGRLTSPVVKECTYEERKQEQERLEQESGDVDTSVNPLTGKKYVYEYDRFYKFHINELKGNKDSGRGVVLGDKETDECFAGYKILEKEAIRSAKGTVRGVKNRVRAGIATFLQKPSSQAYIKKELGKVVVYTTTSGIVRKTFYNCKKVKQILRTHMVKYDELDLFGDAELQTELRDRLGSTVIQLPQLFIDGQHIGGFDTVERLNESGELREMLKPYQSEDACTVCLFCGGYQWQLCPVCNGSKRSVHRNDFTAEFVALKCAKCDVNGLIRCPHC